MVTIKRQLIFGIAVFSLVACSIGKNTGLKSSNRLLDEFRIDEYRGYVVISVEKAGSKFSNVAMYNSEKKRYVYVKIPKWLSDYWQEGDTVK
jgi:hypothetical protein